MPKEQRTKFYREKHQLMGDNLKAAIKETISESHSQREMEAFIKDGKFLDKEDMAKKFEGKPDQLKSVFENTKRFYCGVRNVLLYEDPEYGSKKISSNESSKDSKREISSGRDLKPSKVPKVREENGEPETLSKGQVKLLNDHIKALADGVEKLLKDLLEEAGQEGIATMIPPPVLQKLKLAIASIDAQKTSIELVVENNIGDVQNVLKELNDAKKDAAATVKVVKAQLLVAKAFAPPAAPVAPDAD
jgi:hypothetical protein